LYASILARRLLEPDVEIAQVFNNVRFDGWAQMHQRPFFVADIDDETFLAAAPDDRDCNGVAIKADKRKMCFIPGDGRRFKDCRACPNMVVVPPGDVTFHGPLGTWDSIRQYFTSDDLRPAYKISFARAVAVSPFPVTLSDWKACEAGGGCPQHTPGKEELDHPVVNVSWNDAMKYLGWLNGQSHREYRLLSEAELEYLKGKNAGAFENCSNCDRIVSHITTVYVPDYNAKGGAGGHSESRESFVADPRVKTLPVIAFVPNSLGLYGVKDNVDDLLADCWTEETFEVIPNNGSPLKADKCESHTIIGTKVVEKFLRNPYIDYRWPAKPDVHGTFTGFRVARDLKDCEFQPNGCEASKE
jgi:formylglycine-generating enzyme required for sulfatase activity